jgi:hypothetical protein
MELHRSAILLALARSPNSTRASKPCNVAQPTLTEARQEPEHAPNGALVYRERQPTQLTDLRELVFAMIGNCRCRGAVIFMRGFQGKAIALPEIGLAPCLSATLSTQPPGQAGRQRKAVLRSPLASSVKLKVAPVSYGQPER